MALPQSGALGDGDQQGAALGRDMDPLCTHGKVGWGMFGGN